MLLNIVNRLEFFKGVVHSVFETLGNSANFCYGKTAVAAVRMDITREKYFSLKKSLLIKYAVFN